MNNETKIVPVEKLHFYANNEKRSGKRRHVETIGIIAGASFAREIGMKYATIQKVLDGIERVIRCGCQPVLGEANNGIRFFPVLKDDYKTVEISCLTEGKFRKRVNGIKVDCKCGKNGEVFADSDKEGSAEAFVKQEAERKAASKAVTPDTMVKCPNCGTEFRVGKVLNANN